MRTIARHVLVRGMVTGVGFRYSALRKAAEFSDLCGFVRNVDERTVECVVQGPEPDVEDFVEWLRRGPPSARVLDCRVAEWPVSEACRSFHLAY